MTATPATPLITNDAVVLGLLAILLAAVFSTASSDRPFWRRFYTYVPSLLLCYFLPSLLGTFGIVSPDSSKLYAVASRYLLPASLVLMTLALDFKALLRLGPKALTLFLTGTVGVMVGGPVAFFLVGWISPSLVGGVGNDDVWRGLSAVAGSWIGGGANQTALKEVYQANDSIFGMAVAVDVLVANLWMAALLWAAANREKVDRWFKADARVLDEVRDRFEGYRASIARMPSLADTIKILGVGFGVTAVAHLGADAIAPWIAELAPELEKLSLTSTFFWIVSIATAGGLVLSFFPRLRALEGAGASQVGSVLLYFLIATIGLNMDLRAVVQVPGLFLVGLVWILIHGALLVLVAKLLKAPVFFAAVGSQANIGGAASAPVVAAAFHPALAPVGVILAVFGYVLGTYCGWLTGQVLRLAAP
ncbi:MAG: DUF819 family protein [Thermoanaerobaculia bacterium]|nr:DUF819 family protein [Thermoanaerobaculia bacterium]